MEHSRIYYFENGGHVDVYLSSADWMTRNLTRRIELMCPVLDREMKKMMIQILNVTLHDNVKARELMPNGMYSRIKNELTPYRSQFEAMKITSWKKLRLES